MTEEIFTTEKLSFVERIKKHLGIKIIVFLFLGLIPVVVTPNDGNYLIAVLFPLFILFVLLIITLNESKKYIYEVRIDSNEIKFYGYDFDKEWIEKCQIKDVAIQISEHRSKSGGIIGYCIIFKNANKKVTINKLYNWNNFTLYKLFTEFKKEKGERIIIDEKSLLDGIKKRAEYLNEWEDEINKTTNNS